MPSPKYRYIIVTPENDVLGTDDVDLARSYGDNDEVFVIDTITGRFSFEGSEADVEARP